MAWIRERGRGTAVRAGQVIYLAVVTVCGAAFVTVGQLLYNRHEHRAGSPPAPRRGPSPGGRRVLQRLSPTR